MEYIKTNLTLTPEQKENLKAANRIKCAYKLELKPEQMGGSGHFYFLKSQLEKLKKAFAKNKNVSLNLSLKQTKFNLNPQKKEGIESILLPMEEVEKRQREHEEREKREEEERQKKNLELLNTTFKTYKEAKTLEEAKRLQNEADRLGLYLHTNYVHPLILEENRKQEEEFYKKYTKVGVNLTHAQFIKLLNSLREQKKITITLQPEQITKNKRSYLILTNEQFKRLEKNTKKGQATRLNLEHEQYREYKE